MSRIAANSDTTMKILPFLSTHKLTVCSHLRFIMRLRLPLGSRMGYVLCIPTSGSNFFYFHGSFCQKSRPKLREILDPH